MDENLRQSTIFTSCPALRNAAPKYNKPSETCSEGLKSAKLGPPAKITFAISDYSCLEQLNRTWQRLQRCRGCFLKAVLAPMPQHPTTSTVVFGVRTEHRAVGGNSLANLP